MVENHRHCVICGKVIPATYVKHNETPFCSLQCRVRYEEKEGEVKKQRMWWLIMLMVFIGFWLLMSMFLGR